MRRSTVLKHFAAIACGLLAVGCATTAARGELMYAQDLFAEGNYREAIASAEIALSLARSTPEIDAEANYLKARSLEALGATHEALVLYRYVAERYPTTVHAYQATGRLEASRQSSADSE